MTYSQLNPKKTSDGESPLNDVVSLNARPAHYRDVLSDPGFSEAPWTAFFGDGRFFYLSGVNEVLRLLKETGTGFLKSRGYLDRVTADAESLRDWSDQSGLELNLPISLPRAREIGSERPTFFYKCVESMMAFELAIAENDSLNGRISRFWVYEYMRIVPAVYNIRSFNTAKLEMLRASDAEFDVKAAIAIGQPEKRLLDELASGRTVTLKTATALQSFVNETYPDHEVKEVRNRPGRKNLGKGPASELEELLTD